MKLMQYIQYLFLVSIITGLGAIIFGVKKNSLPKDSGELATSKISEEVLIYKDSGEFLI